MSSHQKPVRDRLPCPQVDVGFPSLNFPASMYMAQQLCCSSRKCTSKSLPLVGLALLLEVSELSKPSSSSYSSQETGPKVGRRSALLPMNRSRMGGSCISVRSGVPSALQEGTAGSGPSASLREPLLSSPMEGKRRDTGTTASSALCSSEAVSPDAVGDGDDGDGGDGDG